MGRHWNLFDPFSLDDGPALRRRQKLFLVLVGGAVSFLTALIVTFGQRSARQVEQHLLVDAQSVLTRDFPQLRLNVHGRQIDVVGTVGSGAEQARVQHRLSQRWGVRSVNTSGLRIKATTVVSPSDSPK